MAGKYFDDRNRLMVEPAANAKEAVEKSMELIAMIRDN